MTQIEVEGRRELRWLEGSFIADQENIEAFNPQRLPLARDDNGLSSAGVCTHFRRALKATLNSLKLSSEESFNLYFRTRNMIIQPSNVESKIQFESSQHLWRIKNYSSIVWKIGARLS